MIFEEIAICTLIVSIGPYITKLYFLFIILILLTIVASMEIIKRSGLIPKEEIKRKDSNVFHSNVFQPKRRSKIKRFIKKGRGSSVTSL